MKKETTKKVIYPVGTATGISYDKANNRLVVKMLMASNEIRLILRSVEEHYATKKPKYAKEICVLSQKLRHELEKDVVCFETEAFLASGTSVGLEPVVMKMG